jgi:glycosyltransferase involved in cell wall biosynthesis
MRIFLNGLAAFRGGTRTYFTNLIPELASLGRDHTFVLVHSPWQRVFDFDLPPGFRRLVVGPGRRSPLLRAFWEQSRLPALLRQENIDLMFSPTPITCFLSPCPIIVAVRNTNLFSPIRCNDWRYWTRNLMLRAMTELVVRRAVYVIFVSNYSRDVALRRLRIDRQKTVVIYHGLGPHFLEPVEGLPENPFKARRPYLLTVSTIQSHKNYMRLIEAFARMCCKYGAEYDLVFAGAIGSQNVFRRIEKRINEPDLKGRVHYLGEVPYKELPALYREACLFALPSLRESFGHPLVEAMASGIPVAASNVSAIPEICGDAAVYFDPYDVDNITSTLNDALRDKDLREKMAKAGLERRQKFSWGKTVRQMLDLFEAATTADKPKSQRSAV